MTSHYDNTYADTKIFVVTDHQTMHFKAFCSAHICRFTFDNVVRSRVHGDLDWTLPWSSIKSNSYLLPLLQPSCAAHVLNNVLDT
jgi:hypothetical protein